MDDEDSNSTLKRLVIFENFNQQYPAIMQQSIDPQRFDWCDSFRNPTPAVGRMAAVASRRLEHLAASFVVDASHFFAIEANHYYFDIKAINYWSGYFDVSHYFNAEVSWEWPNLSSLALTSNRLTPNENPAEIGAMLKAAAAAAIKMPKLETMEVWNGRKGLAALFKYQASRKYRQATITWRGTWKLAMEPSVIQAWEAVMRHYGGWRLNWVQETLDGALINHHGDAIHHLMLSSQVIRPVSLQQIRIEQKALEGVSTV